jgi:molybdenum cofactor cytidylyltransferase
MKSPPSDRKDQGVTGILLASGCSIRMGFPKPLLPFGNQTMIAYLLGRIIPSDLTQVIIVLGHRAREIKKVLKKGPGDSKAIIVYNPDFKKGMSTSLIRGLSRVDPGNSGIMFILGDQPLLTKAVINKLIKVFRVGSAPIVLPFYGLKPGHPVIFRTSLIPELRQLTGDTGGRELVLKYWDQVQRVSLRPRRIGQDVDTWEDYQKVLKWV